MSFQQASPLHPDVAKRNRDLATKKKNDLVKMSSQVYQNSLLRKKKTSFLVYAYTPED